MDDKLKKQYFKEALSSSTALATLLFSSSEALGIIDDKMPKYQEYVKSLQGKEHDKNLAEQVSFVERSALYAEYSTLGLAEGANVKQINDYNPETAKAELKSGMDSIVNSLADKLGAEGQEGFDKLEKSLKKLASLTPDNSTEFKEILTSELGVSSKEADKVISLIQNSDKNIFKELHNADLTQEKYSYQKKVDEHQVDEHQNDKVKAKPEKEETKPKNKEKPVKTSSTEDLNDNDKPTEEIKQKYEEARIKNAVSQTIYPTFLDATHGSINDIYAITKDANNPMAGLASMFGMADGDKIEKGKKFNASIDNYYNTSRNAANKVVENINNMVTKKGEAGFDEAKLLFKNLFADKDDTEILEIVSGMMPEANQATFKKQIEEANLAYQDEHGSPLPLFQDLRDIAESGKVFDDAKAAYLVIPSEFSSKQEYIDNTKDLEDNTAKRLKAEDKSRRATDKKYANNNQREEQSKEGGWLSNLIDSMLGGDILKVLKNLIDWKPSTGAGLIGMLGVDFFRSVGGIFNNHDNSQLEQRSGVNVDGVVQYTSDILIGQKAEEAEKGSVNEILKGKKSVNFTVADKRISADVMNKAYEITENWLITAEADNKITSEEQDDLINQIKTMVHNNYENISIDKSKIVEITSPTNTPNSKPQKAFTDLETPDNNTANSRG